jgi:hypothetical protein
VNLSLPTDHLIQALDDPIEPLTTAQFMVLLDELVRRSNQDDEQANLYLEYMAMEGLVRHEA